MYTHSTSVERIRPEFTRVDTIRANSIRCTRSHRDVSFVKLNETNRRNRFGAFRIGAGGAISGAQSKPLIFRTQALSRAHFSPFTYSRFNGRHIIDYTLSKPQSRRTEIQDSLLRVPFSDEKARTLREREAYSRIE